MPTSTLELPREMVEAARRYAASEKRSVADMFADLMRSRYGFTMKMIVAFFSCLIFASASASEVRWDCFALHEIGMGNSLGCYYYDDGRSSPEIGLRCTFDKNGAVRLDGKGDANIGWNVAIWVDAVVGDVLDRSYFALEHTVLKDSYNKLVPYPIELSSTGDTLEASKNENIYLALIGNYYDDDGMPCDYYGWVELRNTGTELVLKHSAFSYDSILVGGGAIPEPSSALLLLLGFALTLLKRKSVGSALTKGGSTYTP